ncbi:DUF4282 domain-containing protein [Ectothiorhodospira sp. BSL-9]|uniref:DUF4282 domain-containing protein n=1 Tax=Ectothiorhodospira sp. BSL-9 TaxID=1442136 RepID=UPI0007B42FD2|nr:DUF4282 domain-containing protein [Ectothiorhodospira sp. BSL-9]ANB02666.1 hypothetical protein ECTOBSL9_2117 [Ectothiorhodospira sp. BSL-9]TVQ75311.1 MAG: DUF4282 domain-containing protein [Chromatiaceae bacterium]
MNDYLLFRKMITPPFIHIIFWIGLAAIVIGALGTMFGQSFFGGLMMLVLGVVFWRVGCELMLVLFSIHDRLTEIARKPDLGPGPGPDTRT